MRLVLRWMGATVGCARGVLRPCIRGASRSENGRARLRTIRVASTACLVLAGLPRQARARVPPTTAACNHNIVRRAHRKRKRVGTKPGAGGVRERRCGERKRGSPLSSTPKRGISPFARRACVSFMEF